MKTKTFTKNNTEEQEHLKTIVEEIFALITKDIISNNPDFYCKIITFDSGFEIWIDQLFNYYVLDNRKYKTLLHKITGSSSFFNNIEKNIMTQNRHNLTVECLIKQHQFIKSVHEWINSCSFYNDDLFFLLISLKFLNGDNINSELYQSKIYGVICCLFNKGKNLIENKDVRIFFTKALLQYWYINSDLTTKHPAILQFFRFILPNDFIIFQPAYRKQFVYYLFSANVNNEYFNNGLAIYLKDNRHCLDDIPLLKHLLMFNSKNHIEFLGKLKPQNIIYLDSSMLYEAFLEEKYVENINKNIAKYLQNNIPINFFKEEKTTHLLLDKLKEYKEYSALTPHIFENNIKEIYIFNLNKQEDIIQELLPQINASDIAEIINYQNYFLFQIMKFIEDQEFKELYTI